MDLLIKQESKVEVIDLYSGEIIAIGTDFDTTLCERYIDNRKICSADSCTLMRLGIRCLSQDEALRKIGIYAI